MCAILICLVLTALSVEAGGYAQAGLYTNYQGEYAGAYDNYEARPYAFEYGVSDPHTGDHKSQWETKDAAGVVRGSYSLLESDGSTRIVDYVADHDGFRAVVKKVGIHGQSVESHGGTPEEGASFPPIVVAEPGYVEEPVHVEEPLPVGQPFPVEQPLPQVAPGAAPVAPIFPSYDGGVEHYQNLYRGQQYSIPEGVYRETPQHNLGGYILQQSFIPKQGIYLEQPYPLYRKDVYAQQPYIPPQQPYIPQQQPDVPLQQSYIPPQQSYIPPQQSYIPPQQSYIPPQQSYIPQQPLFAPNVPEARVPNRPPLQAELGTPRAEGLYPQYDQYAELEGKNTLQQTQPQNYVVPEGRLGDFEEPQHVASPQGNSVIYQNQEPYSSTKGSVGASRVDLPVAQYSFEQVFPGENQVLIGGPKQTYGGPQIYQANGGSLQGEGGYASTGHIGEGNLVLNQGEYFPSGVGSYKEPLQYVSGHK